MNEEHTTIPDSTLYGIEEEKRAHENLYSIKTNDEIKFEKQQMRFAKRFQKNHAVRRK